MNAKPAGAIAAMTESLLKLIARLVDLVAQESQAAALSLAWMIGLAIVTAGLLMTGWIAMLACLAHILVQNRIVDWFGILWLAALTSFASAAILLGVIGRRSRHPVFLGTRRQLLGLCEESKDASEPPENLALTENMVAEAHSALVEAYRHAQSGLRHRIESPVLLGTVFLCAIGVGYACRDR